MRKVSSVVRSEGEIHGLLRRVGKAWREHCGAAKGIREVGKECAWPGDGLSIGRTSYRCGEVK